MKIFEIFDLKNFGRSISKCSNFFHNKPFWSRFFSKLCRFPWRRRYTRCTMISSTLEGVCLLLSTSRQFCLLFVTFRKDPLRYTICESYLKTVLLGSTHTYALGIDYWEGFHVQICIIIRHQQRELLKRILRAERATGALPIVNHHNYRLGSDSGCGTGAVRPYRAHHS